MTPKATIVARLRAEADRIEAGGEPECFAYDTDCGYTDGLTPVEAEEDASDALEAARERASDGWSDDVVQTRWGVLVTIEAARLTDRRCGFGTGFDETWDYALVDPSEHEEPLTLDPCTDQECPDCRGEHRG